MLFPTVRIRKMNFYATHALTTQEGLLTLSTKLKPFVEVKKVDEVKYCKRETQQLLQQIARACLKELTIHSCSV